MIGARSITFDNSSDPTVTRQYQAVSKEPLENWKCSLNNPIRKLWYRRYLRWIGSEGLAARGYNFDTLMYELDSIPCSMSGLGSDLTRLTSLTAYSKLVESRRYPTTSYKRFIDRGASLRIRERFIDRLRSPVHSAEFLAVDAKSSREPR